jgi:hypothetical protein
MLQFDFTPVPGSSGTASWNRPEAPRDRSRDRCFWTCSPVVAVSSTSYTYFPGAADPPRDSSPQLGVASDATPEEPATQAEPWSATPRKRCGWQSPRGLKKSSSYSEEAGLLPPTFSEGFAREFGRKREKSLLFFIPHPRPPRSTCSAAEAGSARKTGAERNSCA